MMIAPRQTARVLAVAISLALTSGAAAQVDVEHSGALSRVAVSKPTLAFGASAEVTFDLDYLVRVFALMGEPIVNCGLRVRNLSGSATATLGGTPRRIQIGLDNAAGVSILHLGFVLHRTNVIAFDGSVRALTFRCQPGVIAREDTEPFNVPSNPGIGRFFCANATVPSGGARTALPDMLGPDWCTELGGSFLPADRARALLRDGVLEDIGSAFGFQPQVVALGIGIAELIGDERRRLSELDAAAEPESDAAAQDDGRDPATAIARLAARRGLQEERREQPDTEPDAAATRPGNEPGGVIARLAAQRARAALERTDDEAASPEPSNEAVRRVSPPADEPSRPVHDDELAVSFRSEGTACPESSDRLGRWSENWQKRSFPGHPFWLVSDEDGSCIAGPVFNPSPFSHGLSRVYIKKENGRIVAGFIDQRGTLVYGPFLGASPFDLSGYAWINASRSPALIDTAGNILFPPGQSQSLLDMTRAMTHDDIWLRFGSNLFYGMLPHSFEHDGDSILQITLIEWNNPSSYPDPRVTTKTQTCITRTFAPSGTLINEATYTNTVPIAARDHGIDACRLNSNALPGDRWNLSGH